MIVYYSVYFRPYYFSSMNFEFPGQLNFYSGKVRDVYTLPGELLVMIASDRISAFDVILPKLIPYKGQVLTEIAARMLEACKDICPSWLISCPAPNVSLGRRCDPIKIEMVVRGNLTGHSWRTYSSGKRNLCGVDLPEAMKENDFFPAPIITPSTKAAKGHDEDISKEEILQQGLATSAEWEVMEAYALGLFNRGNEIAKRQGLILADTKYEFGKIGKTIYLMDEIHTPDSSRYFYADGFQGRQAAGERQVQLSKEFVREWLIENNFMGKTGQAVPPMSEEWIHTISKRYIELYEKLTGKIFTPQVLSHDETYTKIIRAINSVRKTP